MIQRGYLLPVAELGAWKDFAILLNLKFSKVGSDYYAEFTFTVEK